MFALWRWAIEWLHGLLVCAVALLMAYGCSAPPTEIPKPPLPSRAAFTEAVLTPLSREFAGNILDQWKAEARAEIRQSGQFTSTLQNFLSLGGPVGKLVGGIMTGFARTTEQRYEEFSTTLDTLKAPLTARLLGLYEGRIVDKGDFFSVCMQGKKKRWARAVGFPRLDDGEGACSKTMVSLSDLNVSHPY